MGPPCRISRAESTTGFSNLEIGQFFSRRPLTGCGTCCSSRDVDWARLILHGGPMALAAYVLGYLLLAWLDTSGSFYTTSNDHGYLFRAIARLVGPNDPTLWHSFTPTVGLISQLIVVPLRITLIATTFG